MSQSLKGINQNNQFALWTKRISGCRKSGMSVSSWCSENGICKSTYYFWQKKVFTKLKMNHSRSLRWYVWQRRLRLPQLCIWETSQKTSIRAQTLRRRQCCFKSCIMLSEFKGAYKVYIACGYTDLRRGTDGLASMVQQQFQLDPFTNTLFLFCGRRRDRIKALYWEGDGFLMLYKRHESGAFQWPRSETEAKILTPQQHRWMMEGLSIEQSRTAPKSALGRALHYLLEQWPYLEDGRLELSNNRAESSIKPFVRSQKNWLFSNTPARAQSSAVIYSLIEIARENGPNPYRYLKWILETAHKISRAERFNPWLLRMNVKHNYYYLFWKSNLYSNYTIFPSRRCIH